MAERSKDFSIEQNVRKKQYLTKHGYAVLEDIVGDVLVKDPSKMTVEFKDGSKKSIQELVALNESVTKLRKSGLKNMMLELLGVKQ